MIFNWPAAASVLRFEGRGQSGGDMRIPNDELQRLISGHIDDIDEWQDDTFEYLDLPEDAAKAAATMFSGHEPLDWWVDES